MTWGSHRLLLAGAMAALAACSPRSSATPRAAVADRGALARALQDAGPGSEILVAPGDYAGGLALQGLRGAPGRPIVIAAADPGRRPRFVGGATGLHLSNVAHLELRDLTFTGASGNGLNIDDGGTADSPSHHVTLLRLRVSDVGPQGNRDGVKLSGLVDFRVAECTLERWGEGGSGIDMVGCHRGVIEGSTLRHGRAGVQGNGVQIKGGSSEITVRGNLFDRPGGRGVNLGGNTGRPYFRPPAATYEARDLRVEGNTFIGSPAPVAFVGVDGATVRANTFYRPERWIIRILQENREPGMIPCRGGVFEDNIAVFHSVSWVSGGLNIGDGTQPESFRFTGNVWFCEDRPERSCPTLPVPETGALIGRDPLLRSPETGDFRLREGSPAAGKGAAGRS